MADRFFVTVIARDRERRDRLFAYDLDLFAPDTDERGQSVRGLMRIEDVARLVGDGYEVLVTQPEARPGTLPTAGFDEWLKDATADLDNHLARGD